jgi:hypothetical protein
MQYDKSYLAEKAETVRRGAIEIIEALEKKDEEDSKWARSYVIDGILRIEDALASLHCGARNMMEICEETENDYLLRHMGEIKRGM